MSLLAVKSLSLILVTPLFTDLSFTLGPGDRLGLIAANGRGKSTLLRCLADLAEPTNGEITRARGAKVALVTQDLPPKAAHQTLRAFVSAALSPEAQDFEGWRVDVILDDLQVPEALRDQALGTLSGGWQRTALLAHAAVTEPDVLLLDEPTNHLDLSRIGQLQTWLAALPRATAVIIASHDRAFLDAATTRSLFLRPENSRLFPLPYTHARQALTEIDAADARRFDNDIAKADQLRKQAAKLKNIGINSGSDLLITKTKQLKDRADRIESSARAAHRDLSAGTIKLAHSGSHAKALITLQDAKITTPDGRLLFTTGQKWIEPGDRVVLLGANGTGKSRLVAAVLAAVQTQSEGIRAAPSISVGYSDQMLAQLPDKSTPFALVQAVSQSDQAVKSNLAGAGIKVDWQDKPVATLSGGQKARLAMLLLRLAHPSFHLLDEPTNHLDIEGQEALESELTTESATCLLVSHDRSFVRNTANRFWRIIGKKLVEEDSPEAFFASELAR